VIGALCSRSSHVREAPRYRPWTVTIGYRYQDSFRHFVGTVEQKQREIAGTQIRNVYHLFDIHVSRQVTPRWAVQGSLPVLFAYRNQLYVPRGEFRVDSIGDATLGGRAWLFRPPTESGANVGVGLNLKLPTGDYKVMDEALDRNGNVILATADQSIQAGDGGTGFALDLQAYKPAYWSTMLYFSGIYLFNPRDSNGVSTFRTRPGEEYFSVADQYLARGGISRAVPKVRGLTASLGGRIEGVPARDLLGKSNGFRRPGYAISIDPGLLYERGNYLFSFNMPWAVERNRKRSVPDINNGTHGDAAFADWTLTLSVSRRF
jgi:hypothetical protein